MSDEGDDGGLSTGVKLLIVLAALFLLVPILVVVAAVTASFVVGLGGSGDVPTEPTADFEAQAGDQVQLMYVSGEVLESTRLAVAVEDEDAGTWAELSGQQGEMRAGDEVTIAEAAVGDEIRIAWIDGNTRTTVDLVDVQSAPAVLTA